jgi:hypothetical protein
VERRILGGSVSRLNRALVFVLAFAAFQVGSACSHEKNCDSKASSLAACYDCVGIQDVGGGMIKTPCQEFTFTEGKTCRCKPL